jgi:hypothetical protein
LPVTGKMPVPQVLLLKGQHYIWFCQEEKTIAALEPKAIATPALLSNSFTRHHALCQNRIFWQSQNVFALR